MVTIARPPAGKDWNDCHVQSGLSAIRAVILQACPAIVGEIQTSALPNVHTTVQEEPKRVNLDVCTCGRPSYLITEQNEPFCKACYRARGHRPAPDEACCVCGDFPDTEGPDERLYCFDCVPGDQGEPSTENTKHCNPDEQQEVLPASNHGQANELVSEGNLVEQFTMANHRCRKHGRMLCYSDEMGGSYCDHVDCWSRYRLIRSGAKHGYPALTGVIDPRDYLADTSKESLYYTDAHIPIYPTLPVVTKQLIVAGVDAWRAYVKDRDYQEIDQAIKALIADNATSVARQEMEELIL